MQPGYPKTRPFSNP